MCVAGGGGGGGVPLQVDTHLNGSFLIVCPGSGSMCVWWWGGGGGMGGSPIS